MLAQLPHAHPGTACCTTKAANREYHRRRSQIWLVGGGPACAVSHLSLLRLFAAAMGKVDKASETPQEKLARKAAKKAASAVAAAAAVPPCDAAPAKPDKKKKRAADEPDETAPKKAKKPKADKPKADKAIAAAAADGSVAAAEDPNALEHFALSDAIKAKLRAAGVAALFPIQAATFKFVMDGHDVVGRARTGQARPTPGA